MKTFRRQELCFFFCIVLASCAVRGEGYTEIKNGFLFHAVYTSVSGALRCVFYCTVHKGNRNIAYKLGRTYA